MKIFKAVFLLSFFVFSNAFAAGAAAADQKCSEPKDATAKCEDSSAHGHEDKKAHHAKVLNSLFPERAADRGLAQIPVRPELTSPPFLATVGKSISLNWVETFGSTNYHLQVATDPNFKWLVVNEKFLKETTYQFNAPEVGKYYWRVAGHSTINNPGYAKSNFVGSVFIVK